MPGCIGHGTTETCNADKKCVWSQNNHRCLTKGSHTNWKTIGIVVGSIAGAIALVVLIWVLLVMFKIIA